MPHQKLNWLMTIVLLPSLVWGLTGCGGDSAAPAEAKAAVEAPVEAPAETEDSAVTEKAPKEVVETREPATVMEAAQVIDLRDMLPLDEVEILKEEIGFLAYLTSGTKAEVVDFYHIELAGLGWQKINEEEYNSGKNIMLTFKKEDFYLALIVSENHNDFISVTLKNHGNFDVRSLPKVADAEIKNQNEVSAVYVTPAEAAAVAKFVRQELAALGWQEYSDRHDSPADTSGRRAIPHFNLHFKKKGIALETSISAAPNQDGKTMIFYSVALLPADFPVMPDAEDIVFDNINLSLSYTTPADFETVLDFYRSELAALGQKERSDAGMISQDSATRFFESEAEISSLELARAKAGQTGVTFSVLPVMEVAAPTATPTPAPLDTPTPFPLTELPLDSSAFDSSKFPLPAGAQEVTYDADLDAVGFVSLTDVASLVEFYRRELPAQGWQEMEDFSAVSERDAFLTFEQGEATLWIEIFEIIMGDGVQINLDADGLETSPTEEITDDSWSQPDLPPATINGVPIAPGAEGVTAEGDEVRYLVDTDFAGIIEFYRPTLAELELDSSCLDDLWALDSKSIICSISNGRASIDFNLSQEADGRTNVKVVLIDEAEMAEIEATNASGTLTTVYKDGLFMPDDYSNYVSEGSQFRRSISATSPSDLVTLLEFYRRELPNLRWQEQLAAAVISDNQASLSFESPDGTLTVELNQTAMGETGIHLNTKLTSAAEKAGLLPRPGQARLLITNFAEVEAIISIGDQEIKIAPGQGIEDSDGLSLDLAPGHYPFTITMPGQEPLKDELDLGADETWGMVVGPGGVLPLPIY